MTDTFTQAQRAYDNLLPPDDKETGHHLCDWCNEAEARRDLTTCSDKCNDEQFKATQALNIRAGVLCGKCDALYSCDCPKAKP